MRTGIRAYLGENNPDIEKFGFVAIGPRRKLSVEEKALRADKARRTRQARYTMGPKQKEAIKAESLPSLTIHGEHGQPTTESPPGKTATANGTLA